MDANRFDALLRLMSDASSRRGTLRLLAGSALSAVLAVGAVPAEAKKGKKGKAKAGKKEKVTLCHNGQTISVSLSVAALKAHEGHGDILGPCGAGAPCISEPPTTTCSTVVCGSATNNCGRPILCPCTDPATPDCCENTCLAKCAAGEFRNRTSCQCVPCRQETPTGAACASDEECCSNVCGAFNPVNPNSQRTCRKADCLNLGDPCEGTNMECCSGHCAIPNGSSSPICMIL